LSIRTYLVGLDGCHVLALDLAFEAGDHEAAGILGNDLAVDLVAHVVHGPAARADEGDAGCLHHVHELGVLGQEAISGRGVVQERVEGVQG
jgi:hypothetical protein